MGKKKGKDKDDKGPGVGDLCAACVAGNIGAVRQIINAGVKVDKGDFDKRRPLHLACAEGKLPVVRRMLEELKAKTDVTDLWGGTPLDDALRAGHTAVSDFLLSKGAPVGKNAFANDDAGVLCTAGAKGNVGAIQGLARRGVDVNLGDYDKRTCIHLASSEGQLAVIKALVALKANVDPIDRFGGTPLDDAQRSNHKEVCKYLQSVGGTSGKGGSVSTQDAADLCDAASSGDLEKLRAIVRKGVDSNAGDYDLRTAIHLAAAEGLKDVLVCLFDELDGNPNVVDRWGGTPLDDAKRAGHKEVVEYLKAKGAVPGKTSLYTEESDLLFNAVVKNDMTCIRGMVELKADVNAGNFDKRTALHLAASDGKLDLVKLFVDDLQADVNAKDRWSQTPLDDAVFFEREEVGEFLRSKGAESGRAKKASSGGAGKKKAKTKTGASSQKASAEVALQKDDAQVPALQGKADKDAEEDMTDASTNAGKAGSSSSGSSSTVVSSWEFRWCLTAEPQMYRVHPQSQVYAGIVCTLVLCMSKPMDPQTQLQVSLTGPTVMKGILDKQPPGTKLIQLQFDIRLPGEYSLEAIDLTTGELMLKDAVAVLPRPSETDDRPLSVR